MLFKHKKVSVCVWDKKSPNYHCKRFNLFVGVQNLCLPRVTDGLKTDLYWVLDRLFTESYKVCKDRFRDYYKTITKYLFYFRLKKRMKVRPRHATQSTKITSKGWQPLTRPKRQRRNR